MLDFPALTSGRFTTGDGVELYFEDTGPATSTLPVLFFVYGLGCSIQHWKYPITYFLGLEPGQATKPPRQRRIIWADFRGHGKSHRPLPGQRLTMDLITQDMAALCAYLGVTRACFLGQSMGGSLAILMAYRYRELCSSIVLLASPGRDPGANLPLNKLSRPLWDGLIEVNKRLPQALRGAYRFGLPRGVRSIALLAVRELVRQFGFNPDLSRTEDIEDYVRQFFAVDPNVFFDLARDLTNFDVGQLEPKVKAPALILAGAQDQVVPLAEARYLASHLPRSELAVIEHGSHCPHFDDPGLVCRLIDDFLLRHET